MRFHKNLHPDEDLINDMVETCRQQEASRPTEYMMMFSSQANYDPLGLRPYDFAEAEATAEAQDAIAIGMWGTSQPPLTTPRVV